MFDSIRSRVIIIALLIIGSIVALIPRNTTIRERDVNTGVMRDTTVRRVPLKLGLDLALTVLRKRIDEFGVTEPLIQKQGDDRIIVELAGITDPARAKAIVQRSAFLEFRITDRSEALEKALPALDRALLRAGVKPAAGAPTQPSAVTQLLQGDTGKKAAATDTGVVVGGVLSSLIQSGAQAGY